MSVENHEWFNKQPPEEQNRMNRAFQEYKKCQIEVVDDLALDLEVKSVFFEPQELFKEEKEKERQERKRRLENRQRKKELQKLRQEYVDR